MQCRLLASAFLLFACTPKPADTDGDTGSSGPATDGAEATSATNTAPTTGGETTTAAPTAASVGDDGTSTSTTTGPGTGMGTAPTTLTGDDTGTGGIEGACADVCMHWDACAPGSAGRVDDCIATCIAESHGPGDCTAASDALWICVDGLSCEEALKFLTDAPTSCLAELAAADQACMAVPCDGEVGGGSDTCQFEQQCEGLKQEIVCDLEVCTCSENGTPGKQCPTSDICPLDEGDVHAAVNACCGFDW